MKVLLDETLPHRLRQRLGGHEVFTVSYMGWARLKNGELLEIAEETGFEVFVTGDQTLSYEQNLAGWRMAVFGFVHDQQKPILVCVNQPDLNLGQADPFEPAALERPPSQQLRSYEEMRRQAIWAFNWCCAFAGLGVLQGLVGLVGIFWNPKVGGALLGSAVLFGALSNWGLKFSRSANSQFERITSHERARELIETIEDPIKRYEEISKYVKTIMAQSRN